jgi:hypothetical protein
MLELFKNLRNRYRNLSYSIQKVSRFIQKYVKASAFHIVFLIFIFTAVGLMNRYFYLKQLAFYG